MMATCTRLCGVYGNVKSLCGGGGGRPDGRERLCRTSALLSARGSHPLLHDLLHHQSKGASGWSSPFTTTRVSAEGETWTMSNYPHITLAPCHTFIDITIFGETIIVTTANLCREKRVMSESEQQPNVTRPL